MCYKNSRMLNFVICSKKGIKDSITLKSKCVGENASEVFAVGLASLRLLAGSKVLVFQAQFQMPRLIAGGIA